MSPFTPSDERGRLLLVDGHAYAYRAFYAIRSLTSPTGEPTNAIYGFIKMLAKMREAVEPTHLAVIWDGGLAAERKKLLPEYKAQRPSMPEDLDKQISGIQTYLDSANVPSFCQDGVEADDLIATVAVCRRIQLPSAPWARRPDAGAHSSARNEKASAAKLLRMGNPLPRCAAASGRFGTQFQ